jgi:hypothetical protein
MTPGTPSGTPVWQFRRCVMEGSIENKGWRSGPSRVAAWTAAAGLMLVPVSVQLIRGDFGWDMFDFGFAAAILSASCFIFDLAARKSPNFSYLAGAGAALAAGFGLFVVNGAVGLVGSEDEAHNLMFGAVLLTAIAGAAVARGRPAALAGAMLAAAIVHIAVSAGLLIRAAGVSDGSFGTEVVGLSVFAAMWLASAWLFRGAARRAGR